MTSGGASFRRLEHAPERLAHLLELLRGERVEQLPHLVREGRQPVDELAAGVGQADPDDAAVALIALAAYVQCLVKLLLDRYEQGQVLSYHRMLLSENKWLALRYGLDAPLMDLAAGKRVKMAARTLARRRIRELRPISRDLGCADELARIDWVLEHGNGADRQRQVWNANRDIAEVAEEIAVAAERV